MKILTEKEQLKNKVLYLYDLNSKIEGDRSFVSKKMKKAYRNKTVLFWKNKYDNYNLVLSELHEYRLELDSRLTEIEKKEKREKELLLS